MNWLQKIAGRKKVELPHVVLDDQGVHFETGKPVEMNYIRNTRKAPYLHTMYQQHIEPAGRYMIFNPSVGDSTPGWESGSVSFQNPLVIAFNTDPMSPLYNENSWKRILSKKYHGLRGKRLSVAIKRDGYDGIITVGLGPDGKPAYTKEIIDLSSVAEET